MDEVVGVCICVDVRFRRGEAVGERGRDRGLRRDVRGRLVGGRGMASIHHGPGAGRATPLVSAVDGCVPSMSMSVGCRSLFVGKRPAIRQVSTVLQRRRPAPFSVSGGLQTARLEHKVTRLLDAAMIPVPVHVAGPDKGIADGRAVVRLAGAGCGRRGV